MMRFQIYSLKDLLEDFYISEISSVLGIEEEEIDYQDSQQIDARGKKIETLLSERQTSKKEVFQSAESRVLKYLQTFKCEKNKDVQEFLHSSEKSIRMQKESITRTYFLVDTDREDSIAAYFAISFKPIILEKDHVITKSKKKRLPIHKNEMCEIEIIPTILIGQIGRSDSYSKEDINLADILDFVFGVINKVREYIGGRVVLVEVNKEQKLIEHYGKFGFEKIQEQGKLTQLMQFVANY